MTSGRRFAGLFLVFAGFALPLPAQEKDKLPPPDRAPQLVLAHPGPHAPVRALAFSPDGSSLYVGGFDKQVRRYEFAKDKWTAVGLFRVPVAPGNAGVVNAVAVSPDGKWVAAAGRAPIRGESWAGTDDGIDVDSRHLSPLMREDAGVIYLFDPTKPEGGTVIRGPRAGVRAMAFANPPPESGPALVTTSVEWDDKDNKYLGTVRVFNVKDGKELASRADLPANAIPPGLAAWGAGDGRKTLRVAVAWQKTTDTKGGELLLWDIDTKGNGTKGKFLPDMIGNAPLALRVGKDGAAELITAGVERNGAQFVGRLTVRSADPIGDPTKLDAGTIHIPLAVAALPLKEAGDATAVLAEVDPPPAGTAGLALRLQLLDAKGKTLGKPVPLVGDPAQEPSLAASPKGRFIAVAGFSDNRVEVYDAAEFEAGRPAPMKLEGGASGFSKVAFLKGEKLWVGHAADTPSKGGVVLDLDRNARVAGTPPAKAEVDAPAGGDAAEIVKPDVEGQPARQVSVTIAGQRKTITPLPAGQRVTAVAFLPGKPAWDAALGPVVAVAHLDIQSKQAVVTLFDPFDPTPDKPKPLYRFGGPTLPVLSLAFSGTRPLLAAAGEDGTVVVWSLKNLSQPLPTVEGLLVTDRGGEVIVTAVRPDSPANGKLNVNDVIESVADAKGAQKPVKTALEFLLIVRSLKVGDNAQVKAKNKAAVAVKVGTATGFRHPLFALWVDPVAKNGKHDWVGWTNSGPYDANAEAAEARIGWITATGDPAQPVAFAGANQYRKLFYWRDFIRLLVETGDYNEAVKRRPQPRRPTLSAGIPGTTTLRDGRTVTREKIDSLEVSVNDPDSVLDLDRAELRWQVTGPGGESAWTREPLTANRAVLDLGKHEWKRGEHRIHAKLFESAGAPESAALHSITIAAWFMPPPPVLSVQLDKKPVAPNAEIVSENDEVEVVAVVDAKRNPDDAAVTVSWTGGKPVELRRNPKGAFDPVKVKLQPVGTMVILVTATNLGDGVDAEAESQAVELRVRKQALKKVVPPPGLKLLVLTEYDHRTATNEPYVVSTQKATVTASAERDAKLTAFQWRSADAEWKGGKWEVPKEVWKDDEAGWEDDEGARKANTRTRDDLTLPVPNNPAAPDKALVVQVRAKVADSEYSTDTAVIRYDGLPDVSVTMPPALVTTPELNLAGGLKVTGKRPFTVRVLVTSSRTGRTREFDPTPNPMLTGWESNITFFPGENLLGYVVKYDNDRKEIRKAGLVEIRYVRPPVVAGAAPVDVGTGSVGDVTLAVLSSPDTPPSELRVNGVRTEFRTHPRPLRLFGAGLWLLHARGVPVNAGEDRLKPVPVVVWNAERESSPVPVKVDGRAEVKVPPPAIRLMYKDGVITPDRPLSPVSEPKFSFDLKVTSDTRFTRVELWHGFGADVGLTQVAAVKASDAVAVPGGFELTARPTLTLHPGTRNYVRVVASNEGGGTESFAFNVSYAPPPVRVVIDAITEAKPNGKRIQLSPGSAEGLEVDSEAIEVEGRVAWTFDDEAVAQDRNLTVVFSANGVAHLPVPVPLVKEGKERKFKGRVYLNALGNLDPKAPSVTRLRAELRSGGRPVPIPQAGLREAEFRVTSKSPLRKQRLHVLMLGVEVPESQRKPLIKNVIYAVGGKIPGDNPNFTQGRFEHPRFSFAQLYTPQLTYTNAGQLNALLNAARLDIEWRARQSGEDWVNDVIVVYYQGEDWVDKETGRWLLHSARSITPAPGQNPAQFAIRLDNLPQVPGLPVGVVNVASVAQPVGDLAVSLLCLRFAWEDGDSTGQLLTELGKAVRAERTVSKILVMLDEGISKSGKWKAKPGPLDALADGPFSDVARREIGVPKEKP